METIRVERGNVILDIPAEDKAEYMKQGYSVVDKATGKVIEQAIGLDVTTLQYQLLELKGELEATKAENEKLKAEVAKLKPKKSAAKAE